MSTVAAIAPIAVIVLAFAIYCLYDIFTRPIVKHLPRWVWAIICLVTVPLGGIVYLVVGRAEA